MLSAEEVSVDELPVDIISDEVTSVSLVPPLLLSVLPLSFPQAESEKINTAVNNTVNILFIFLSFQRHNQPKLLTLLFSASINSSIAAECESSVALTCAEPAFLSAVTTLPAPAE